MLVMDQELTGLQSLALCNITLIIHNLQVSHTKDDEDLLMVSTDFNCIFSHTMEVNGDQKQKKETQQMMTISIFG